MARHRLVLLALGVLVGATVVLSACSNPANQPNQRVKVPEHRIEETDDRSCPQYVGEYGTECYHVYTKDKINDDRALASIAETAADNAYGDYAVIEILFYHEDGPYPFAKANVIHDESQAKAVLTDGEESRVTVIDDTYILEWSEVE
jgi:ribosomal protein L15E